MKRRWKVLARHRWVTGATITESINSVTTERRFTATIRGFTGWFIWQGYGQDQRNLGEKIRNRVTAIRTRIDNDDPYIFTDKDYSRKAIPKGVER